MRKLIATAASAGFLAAAIIGLGAAPAVADDSWPVKPPPCPISGSTLSDYSPTCSPR